MHNPQWITFPQFFVLLSFLFNLYIKPRRTHRSPKSFIAVSM
jgi:hypothetical protein